MPSVRIAGFDPGLALTGYAVLEGSPGGEWRPLTYGVIRTPSREPLPRRLARLYDQVRALLARFRPQEAAVEQIFFQRNVRTAFQVGQARGVVLLALAQMDVPVAEYTPTMVKQTLTGSGMADKAQVQYMMQALLGLPQVPRPDDAADALAVALCHARHRWLQRVE